MTAETPLTGGMVNEGLVVRVGDTVRRPRDATTPSVLGLLAHLAAHGFPAPVHQGVDELDRDVFAWVAGDVAVSDDDVWADADDRLAQVARLLRRYHDCVGSFTPPPDAAWSPELADPHGGPIICHNDVCRENVVFGDAGGLTLLDFDFAAPGRPVWDVAFAAAYWVPLLYPDSGAPAGEDKLMRLRLFAGAYGWTDATTLADAIVQTRRVAGRFVRDRAQAGRRAFAESWRRRGAEAGEQIRLDWFETNHERFVAALS